MLFAFLSGFKFLATQVEGDLSDRLHYYMTSNLLIALAILVSWKQFGGRPIECMIPETFHQPWEQYAENYCWAESTYYVPFNNAVPTEEERINKRINYYQWVPFYLLVAGVGFQVPCLFWKLMAGHSGIKIHDLIEESADRKNLAPLVRQETIRFLTVHIENALRFHRRTIKRQVMPHRCVRLLNLPYTAVYVTSCYFVTKVLYMVNVILQFYLMNLFLDTNQYSFFGFGAIHAILNGSDWQQSGIFPRVTMCDMQARTMGQVQRFSFQCVLTINLFNEKIFLFLWIWFGLLFILTLISFLYWCMVTLCPCFPRNFINRHLALSEIPIDIKACQLDIRRFISKYLRTDGIFILRMVTIQAGVIFGTDLIANLYRSFYGIEEQHIKRKKKAEITKDQNGDVRSPSAMSEEKEIPCEYQHSAEQSAFNKFAQQLATIRLRSNRRGSYSPDSTALYKAAFGQAITMPNRFRGSVKNPTDWPLPLINRSAVPHPMTFEPKFVASKLAKRAAQRSVRERERELRAKIEKETGMSTEGEDDDDDVDDNEGGDEEENVLADVVDNTDMEGMPGPEIVTK